MLRRNGPVMKSVESVLRTEGSLRWKGLGKDVGLEPGVKERGSKARIPGPHFYRTLHPHNVNPSQTCCHRK